MDLASLTYASAKPLEGTAFRVALTDGAVVTLTLDDVVEYSARDPHRPRTALPLERQPFALCFNGPRSPILPQAMYTLRGDTVAFEALFIVPVGQNGTGTQYEAVFT